MWSIKWGIIYSSNQFQYYSFSFLPSLVLTKNKLDDFETKSCSLGANRTPPLQDTHFFCNQAFSFHVHKADVHDKQSVSGQGSGRRGQHFHHLCLCVHISHHNEATHRALHKTLSRTVLSVLSTAHAQHMVRKVSSWCHRYQL